MGRLWAIFQNNLDLRICPQKEKTLNTVVSRVSAINTFEDTVLSPMDELGF